MACRSLASPPSLRVFAKEWPQKFSGPCDPVDGRPHLEEIIDTLTTLGEEPEGDVCELFMASYDDGLTSLDMREAIQFIQPAINSELRDQNRLGKKGTAWLDDRTWTPSSCRPIVGSLQESAGQIAGPEACILPRPIITITAPDSPTSNIACGINTTDIPMRAIQASQQSDSPSNQDPARSPRSYSAPLTADDLYRYLREKQFDHAIYLNADRRLIHVADPDPHDFLALIKSARAHQQASLQSAICKYLALDTSIKVTIEEGYPVFRLEFHIPHFALRRSQPENDFADRKKRTHRGWMNIGFLDNKDPEAKDLGTLGIHQAQISLTICGTDNSRWTVYCFEDKHFDDDGEIGDDEQTSLHQSDQIARGEFGAEDTIWNAREYYFRVLLIRMRQVQKEWIELVRLIESGIKEHSWGRFFFSPTRTGIPSAVNETTASAWIDSTVQLLGKLLDDIAKTNDAWTRFISVTGDLAFFSDTHSDSRMNRTFNQLTDVFNHMQDLETRLRRISDLCEKWAQTANLRLTSESQRSAQLTVWFISPFAIVSTFFAIPVPIIAFDRNAVSFLISILLYTSALQALLFFWEGRLGRQLWWDKFSRRAKALWNGDAGLTTRNGAGNTVLQRRSTHSAFT